MKGVICQRLKLLKRTKQKFWSLGNRANKMHKRFSDMEDRNIEMAQVEEERELRVKKHERAPIESL